MQQYFELLQILQNLIEYRCIYLVGIILNSAISQWSRCHASQNPRILYTCARAVRYINTTNSWHVLKSELACDEHGPGSLSISCGKIVIPFALA